MATPRFHTPMRRRTGGGTEPADTLDEVITQLATNWSRDRAPWLGGHHSTMVIEAVSERKQTRIGPGYFITWVTTYRDEQDEVVGRQTFRILKFNPDLEVLLK
jgi:hypothetical protein